MDRANIVIKICKNFQTLSLLCVAQTNDSSYDISVLIAMSSNKGQDEPAYQHSLFRAFRCSHTHSLGVDEDSCQAVDL